MLSRTLRTRRRLLNSWDTVRPGDGTAAETPTMNMAERNDELAPKRKKCQPSDSPPAWSEPTHWRHPRSRYNIPIQRYNVSVFGARTAKVVGPTEVRVL
jgi:hypothetical protein